MNAVRNLEETIIEENTKSFYHVDCIGQDRTITNTIKIQLVSDVETKDLIRL